MTKKDIKFIIGLCVVSVVLLIGFIIFTSMRAKNIEYANVYYNNEIILRFDINEDDEYSINGDYGEMTIEVKDQKYRVKDVECPNHDCENIGWVKKGSTTVILCVPNNVFINQEVIE